MMNTSYALQNFEMAAPTAKSDGDRDRAELAGTRMLIAEESFDAMLQMLIDSGMVPKGCAAIMLDRLSTKLVKHALGMSDTQWAIRAPELLDQATRLAARSVTLRGEMRS